MNDGESPFIDMVNLAFEDARRQAEQESQQKQRQSSQTPKEPTAEQRQKNEERLRREASFHDEINQALITDAGMVATAASNALLERDAFVIKPYPHRVGWIIHHDAKEWNEIHERYTLGGLVFSALVLSSRGKLLVPKSLILNSNVIGGRMPLSKFDFGVNRERGRVFARKTVRRGGRLEPVVIKNEEELVKYRQKLAGFVVRNRLDITT